MKRVCKTSSSSSSSSSSLQWSVVAALVLQNLAIPVLSDASFEDQKNFFLPTPDPNTRSPPLVSYTPPAHGSGGTPPAAHGSGGTPPAHGSGGVSRPTPSSAPYHGTPPSNCGNPPARGGGGGSHHQGHHNPSPGGSGGGGYYHSPPTTTTPATPVTRPTPPTSPVIVTPPIIPTPTTPGITIPSPPFSFDPNSPPFTCTYWRNHPALIWAIFGWFGTIGSAFGTTSLPGFGSQTNLLQALSNTRADGFGELYREGTAALLNSMADHTRYPYSATHVRDSFVAALGSNRAAMAQARLFKMANEGRIKPRA